MILVSINQSVYMNIIVNISIMIALVSISTLTRFERNSKKHKLLILDGLIIGISVIILMSMPWSIEEGVIIDARTIIYSISGAFYGFIPTIIAAIMGILYRFYLIGDLKTVLIGSLTIILSSSIGLIWHLIKSRLKFKKIFLEYLVFGFIVNSLSLVFILFNIQRIELVIIFLLVFPFVTAVVGLLTHNTFKYNALNENIKKQKNLLTASINATKVMEIYAVDKDYNYLTFNSFHQKQKKEFYNINIKEGDNYFSAFDNNKMENRIKASFDKGLFGISHIKTSEVESKSGKFLEEHFTPIENEEGEIIGVTVFSYDITERKKYEESILYLSYNDPLTGLYNRRFFEEQFNKFENENKIVSTIYFDINGLKVMNDAFGHSAGDLLLIEAANAIREKFEKYGYVCRVGGDEFVVLLENTTYEDALKKSEELKVLLETKSVHDMAISVSFGISTRTEANETLQDHLKIAEDMMYKNKLYEITSHRNESIKTILNTLQAKNLREERHSERVSNICVLIGNKLSMMQSDLSLLKMIGNLHDIGKIGIPEAILNKPGKLTKEEYEIIKRHPEIGYRILSNTPEYSEIAYDILSHHERYDGTGYPRGLKGDEIPIRARVVSVADALDAMISERPYRKSKTISEAIEEITKNSGTQFDPKVVTALLDVYEEDKNIFNSL